MLSLLKNYIIYAYNDSSLGFLARLYNFWGKSGELANTSITGLDNINVDFLTSLLNNFLSKYLDFVTLNNIFVLVAFLLCLFFSYKFFHYLNKDKLISLLFSLSYSTSLYFIFRVISATSSLYFIFVFPLTLNLLLKRRNPLIIGLVVFSSLMISNYYGFFLCVLVCLWYISNLILERQEFFAFLKNLFIFFLVIIFGISLFLGPTFVKNLPIFGNYSKPGESDSTETKTFSVYRPIEDWYNLSFRPWYFFVPPRISLLFGNFSRNIHEKISSTNYYLTQNYMEEEMAGSYMGWHFLLGMGFVVLLILLKKYKNKEYSVFQSVYKNQGLISKSFFILFCILLISGPPSLTIKGVEIYMPTYLLYHIVPVFRTLVRWSVVIYLFVLLINSFLVLDLYNLARKPWQKIVFITSFLVLNFVFFAVKVPVINISRPPHEIAFIKEAFPDSVSYAVYPKGDYYSVFWTISHKDRLINPTNFVDNVSGFEANAFSKNLLTEAGMKVLLQNSPAYLILYADKVDLKSLSQEYIWVKNIESLVSFFEVNFGRLIYKQNEVYIFSY